MYIEMMEKVIQQSGPKIIMDNQSNAPVPYLNLTPKSVMPDGPPRERRQ
jgi:hypothetical protein